MKTLVICLLALAAFSSAAITHRKFGNSIDDLVRNALEYLRQEMKKHDPYPVPKIDEQVINDDQEDTHLTLDLDAVTVSKASDFTIDHIENNLIEFWAKFAVTIPLAHVEGKFKVTGTALGHNVQGDGTFSIDVTGLKVNGFVQNELIDGDKLHIQSMTVDYTVQDLKFKEQGLVVDGMSEEDLEKFFDTELLKFLQDNERLVCDKIATFATAEINDMIKGMTLEDVIDWLRHLIDPTAAPQLA